MNRSIRTTANTSAVVLLLLASVCSASAETAPVKFISQSVIITSGTAEDPLTDLEWTSSLSSSGDERSINDELELSVSGYSHESYFILEDFFGGGYILPFVLDIPPYADANNNGIEDFFDVSMEVSGVRTEGLHGSEEGGEQFYVTWWRNAGELAGSATIEFPYFEMTFEHTFILMHYEGEYSFVRNANNLEGTLSLTNNWFQDEIRGPLAVRVVNATTINLTASEWTTSVGPPMHVEDDFYEGVFGTNFISYVLVEDGNFGTAEADYIDWVMAIGSGDTDKDGVLDLVDGSGGPVERPTLGIAKTEAGYAVTITGSAGKTYWLEYTGQITDVAWPNHHVVTLTGTTQVMNLPADSTGDVFFRLVEK